MTTIDDALTFIKRNHHAVLATRRADGDVQQSPVLVVADDAGRLLLSTRETAVWVPVTGDVEVVSLPDAMEMLVDYYRRAAGEHEDWDDYRASMVREQRCVVVITPTEAGPNVSG